MIELGDRLPPAWERFLIYTMQPKCFRCGTVLAAWCVLFCNVTSRRVCEICFFENLDEQA